MIDRILLLWWAWHWMTSLHVFDVVLMDMEGGEFKAIQRGFSLLKRCSVFAIEFVPKQLGQVVIVSLNDFASLLLSLNFDQVDFPNFGVSGDLQDVLLNTLHLIRNDGSFEDGIIFRRCNRIGSEDRMFYGGWIFGVLRVT